MPYGISKALGGDSKATDARMERCVADVMASGKPKLNAVLICKSSIQKKLAKGKKRG
jgi:hypothetical protein